MYSDLDNIRMNQRIRSEKVFLIDQEGQKIGNTRTVDALRMAQEAGLDLVEINPKINPPVCKIMDFGRYKYQQKKKAVENAKATKGPDLKEIQLRPNIDDHDFETKLNHIVKFLQEGDKVKVVLKFKGGEIRHQHLGNEKLNKVIQHITEANIGKVEARPLLEGRNLSMILAPM